MKNACEKNQVWRLLFLKYANVIDQKIAKNIYFLCVLSKENGFHSIRENVETYFQICHFFQDLIYWKSTWNLFSFKVHQISIKLSFAIYIYIHTDIRTYFFSSLFRIIIFFNTKSNLSFDFFFRFLCSHLFFRFLCSPLFIFLSLFSILFRFLYSPIFFSVFSILSFFSFSLLSFSVFSLLLSFSVFPILLSFSVFPLLFLSSYKTHESHETAPILPEDHLHHQRPHEVRESHGPTRLSPADSARESRRVVTCPPACACSHTQPSRAL